MIPALIRKMAEARARGDASVTLWGDGSPTREFLYVEDCVDGLLLAADRYDGAEPVNLGTGEEISIRDLAGLVAELTGFEGELVWDTAQAGWSAAAPTRRHPRRRPVRLPRTHTPARRPRAHGPLVRGRSRRSPRVDRPLRRAVRDLLRRNAALCAVIAALVVLTVAVRAPDAIGESLWGDEVRSARVITAPTVRSSLAWIRAESSPPLWFMIGRATHGLGSGPRIVEPYLRPADLDGRGAPALGALQRRARRARRPVRAPAAPAVGGRARRAPGRARLPVRAAREGAARVRAADPARRLLSARLRVGRQAPRAKAAHRSRRLRRRRLDDALLLPPTALHGAPVALAHASRPPHAAPHDGRRRDRPRSAPPLAPGRRLPGKPSEQLLPALRDQARGLGLLGVLRQRLGLGGSRAGFPARLGLIGAVLGGVRSWPAGPRDGSARCWWSSPGP